MTLFPWPAQVYDRDMSSNNNNSASKCVCVCVCVCVHVCVYMCVCVVRACFHNIYQIAIAVLKTKM